MRIKLLKVKGNEVRRMYPKEYNKPFPSIGCSATCTSDQTYFLASLVVIQPTEPRLLFGRCKLLLPLSSPGLAARVRTSRRALLVDDLPLVPH